MRTGSQRREVRVLHKKLPWFPLACDFESGQEQKGDHTAGRCLRVVPQHLILPEKQMVYHGLVPTEPSGVA